MFAASKSGSASAPKDPQFNYVTMLLHGDGTNGAQNNTFLDSSSNNLTITRNGNTTQGSFSPYGSNWSNFFSGTSGQYLNTVANAVFSFGTGDFTVEGWVYPTGTNTGAPMPIVEIRTNATNTTGFAFMREANALTLNVYQNGYKGASTGSLTFNAWNHVALVRSGNTWTYWINGVSSGSFTNSTNLTDGATTGPKIGGSTTAGEVWIGYLSNVRITKGGALYTSTFTPSTTPLTTTVSAGTVSLLTCADNRFIDDSTNAFAITVNGSPSVQRLNPFGAYTEYSTSVIGGSGYFDGTGDFLETTTTILQNYTGDVTIECWFYLTALPTGTAYNTSMYILGGNPSNSNPGTDLAIGNTAIWFNQADYSSRTLSGSWTAITGTWNHLAITRSSNNWTMWLNGASLTTATSSSSFANSTALSIGRAEPTGGEASGYMNGYISNLRIVKSALYTTTFTPPTAPLTAITNTSLLTNFTNGAIFDNAMMNDLETVGNAQISTSVKKYGTGSLAFDGSGDYLASPPTPNLTYGTGNFTIEAWVYLTTTGTIRPIVECRSGGGSTAGYAFLVDENNYLNVYSNGFKGTSSSTITGSSWTHVALVRAGTGTNQTTYYINGTASGTITLSGNLTDANTNQTIVGNSLSGGGQFNGYIDDLRITKGYARYTAAFTAPTKAFPNN